jgi:hypothetical protein
LQLVEVINEDYADFVSLSTKLVNVDGAVLRMQKPLLELRVSTARTACHTLAHCHACASLPACTPLDDPVQDPPRCLLQCSMLQ